MSDHEELESQVAALVLGALDAIEAGGVRAHIEGCASCREIESRLRRAVGALALAVDEVAPPARLREQVLAAAAASRSADAGPRRVRVLASPASPRRSVVARFAGRIPAYAVAAGVAIALVAGTVVGDLVGRASGGPSTPAQVARFTLSGHAALGAARATVIDLKADGVALVDFRGLPAVQQGRVYEIWLVTAAGHADPSGVFVPDGDGGKIVLVDRPLTGYSQMAITQEQGPDGSPAPTQQPQLYGALE